MDSEYQPIADAKTIERGPLLQQHPPQSPFNYEPAGGGSGVGVGVGVNVMYHQENEFAGEKVVKEWNRGVGESYNRLILTTHRIIVEKKRVVGRTHAELTCRQSTDSSIVAGFIQLVSFFQWLLTLGADSDSTVIDHNILLRDVTSMRISRNRMSELAADVKLLLPFTAIPALFYFLVTSYQTGAVIGVFVLMVPFFQLLHIVVKLLVWTDGGAALSVRPGMHRDTLLFITGLIFCCWLSSWGCMLATIFSSTTYGAYVAASVLISVSFLLELVLLRFVQNDKITKGVLQVVTTSNGGNRCFGRRHTGVVSVALTYEDAKDAKHLIWDSRIDITSLSAGRPNSMILQ